MPEDISRSVTLSHLKVFNLGSKNPENARVQGKNNLTKTKS